MTTTLKAEVETLYDDLDALYLRLYELAAGVDALEDMDVACASEAWNAEGGAWAALEALKAIIGRMGQAT
jgi:hypothetical protein